MAKLPIVSGKEVVRVLELAGFSKIRQRGSHVFMAKGEPKVCVTVPMHREVARGTLRAIITSAQLTVEKFAALLDEI